MLLTHLQGTLPGTDSFSVQQVGPSILHRGYPAMGLCFADEFSATVHCIFCILCVPQATSSVLALSVPRGTGAVHNILYLFTVMRPPILCSLNFYNQNLGLYVVKSCGLPSWFQGQAYTKEHLHLMWENGTKRFPSAVPCSLLSFPSSRCYFTPSSCPPAT